MKIFTLCTSLAKTQKNYGIRCTWNNGTIFSRQISVTRTPTVIVPTKTGTNPITPIVVEVPSSEGKLFEGYLDGHIVISSTNTTQEKA